MRNHIFALLITSALITSCSKDDDTVKPVVIPPVSVVIESLHQEVPFPIGASVSVSHMKDNSKYSGVVTTEYNSITAENAMKFDALHPDENTFFWTDADYLVSYAQANNKRIHGHTLNWHTSLPAWLTDFQGDSAAWENVLKNHIQTVVTHFKGKVASWDVVNEAFNDNGTLRNSIWVQKLGTDYIARCFQYAHESDPDAILFYNDYGHEYSSAKRSAINNMISSFLTRGIPIHGTGMQFHITYTETDANISAAIDAAAATGLKVHISELDIRLNNDKLPGFVLTPLLASQQADKYKFVVKAFNAIPAAQKFGITTWNVGDADSWVPWWLGVPDYPLPFDKDYLRKPAYYGIVSGAK